MLIHSDTLKDLIVQVANDSFCKGFFRRRQLMDAVESKARQSGYWTADDDNLSGSNGKKSKGLAQIDWRITDLKKGHRLIKHAHNMWRMP
jgi:hypothetical protein